MKYAFYPGCAVHSTSKEYGDSCKAICKVLDIELVEINDWNCCGAIDAIYSYKPLFSQTLDARNLALAEKMGMDIVTLCSACYHTLSRTNKLLQEDSRLKKQVDEALSSAGLNYNGGVKVRHFIEVLLSDVGLEKIGAKVKAPLTSLNVASYYGCFLVRPPDLTDFDDTENPTSLDELVETVGASSVEYCDKTRCCGASFATTAEEIMLKLSKNILLNAMDAGANCMITACPLCHFNLDAKQKDIERKYDLKMNLPILHFTQFIGLAFEIDPKRLGLDRNCVSPRKILTQYMRSAPK
jgi:heterodisulfide reductase subunit B